MSSVVPLGLVENEARQHLARALISTGPRTARDLVKDTGLSVAGSRYHLRALATAGAVSPCLDAVIAGDEVAYALTPERLPKLAREVLLAEVSLQTCSRLAEILLFEGRQDIAELATRLDLSEQEVTRHLRAMRMEEWAEGMPRFGVGIRADRLSDYDPKWIERWLERPPEEGDAADPREDGTE